jgi:hypothetical protein
MFSGHVLECLIGLMGPGQEVVDLGVEVAADDPGDGVGEVVLRFDAAGLAGLMR